MKKESINYLLFFFSYFILVTLFKRYFSLEYIIFWVGGLIGLFLPFIDHLLYVFVLRPQELTSQRIRYLISQRNIGQILSLLYDTRSERKELVFHSLRFLMIFAILAFWVISSSGNLFGRGLVLGFWLHLGIFFLRKYLDKEYELKDKEASGYLVIGIFLTLFIFGFMY